MPVQTLATQHHFHVPVMGTGFTVDTPARLSHLGIHSVVSLVDDMLLEKMRSKWCALRGEPFVPISSNQPDHRAARISAYLNMLHEVCQEHRMELSQNVAMIRRYLSLLPPESPLPLQWELFYRQQPTAEEIQSWALAHLPAGRLDVNIMTKLDRENFDAQGNKLDAVYNDAHAALRGFALSRVKGALVLSAGLNPRLYGYTEHFPCFYPDPEGRFEKEIILKVSDFRSAAIQGRFLAKKGIWVSEWRVESGLNCGGHAFATDGVLMGPILQEFAERREDLRQELWTTVQKVWSEKGLPVPPEAPPIRLSAQGGVGTCEEHRFLREQYGVESVGWGTPFLLVEEVTHVDPSTRAKLVAAREEDLELSKVSPLGVPYHNLKSNTKDQEKIRHIVKGRPGSACPKRYIALNTEFTEEGICLASRQYQQLKLRELDTKDLTDEEFEKEYQHIVEKSCICVGLGTAALLVNELDTKVEGQGVSICPGPNMAYFTRTYTLDEMVAMIYGKVPSDLRADRPHMFMKELDIYIDYLADKITYEGPQHTAKQIKYYQDFDEELKRGIAYYLKLFASPRALSLFDAEQAEAHCTAAIARINILMLRLQEPVKV